VGTTSLNGTLTIGAAGAGGGTYLLSSTGSLFVYGTEYVGYFGPGTFNQSGGAQTIGSPTAAGTLELGADNSGTGNFILSAGNLTVNGLEYIAAAGDGTFDQR